MNRQTAFFAAAVLCLSAGLAQANAHPTAEAAAASLRALAQKKGIAFHDKQLGNGQKRIALNVSDQAHLNALHEEIGRDKNVLQILHISKSGHQHTLAAFNGELIHLQTPDGFVNWKLNTWGDRLRPSARKMYSAFIHLTPEEGDSMRAKIAEARQNMRTSPTGVIGTAFGQRGMNCTSGWCGLTLGKQNNPLWKIIGLRGESGYPTGFQRDLEHGGNERIIGVAVYGPKIPDFDKNPPKELFQFNEAW